MEKRVVANFIAFLKFPAQYRHILFGHRPYNEKRCRHMFTFQDVEDTGRIIRIGPIVKRQYNFARRVAVFFDDILGGQLNILLIGDGKGRCIHLHVDPARSRCGNQIKHFAIAIIVYLIVQADGIQPFNINACFPE